MVEYVHKYIVYKCIVGHLVRSFCIAEKQVCSHL